MKNGPTPITIHWILRMVQVNSNKWHKCMQKDTVFWKMNLNWQNCVKNSSTVFKWPNWTMANICNGNINLNRKLVWKFARLWHGKNSVTQVKSQVLTLEVTPAITLHQVKYAARVVLNNIFHRFCSMFFFKKIKWAIPGLFIYFRLFNTVDNKQVKKQMFNKILLMTGVEQWTFSIDSDCSTNWATTTSQIFVQCLASNLKPVTPKPLTKKFCNFRSGF